MGRKNMGMCSWADLSFGGSTDLLEAAWIKGCGVKFHPSIWFHAWVHREIISPSGWFSLAWTYPE
jgi:hypothetical protein